MAKWTLKGRQYLVPNAKRWLLNNPLILYESKHTVSIQSEFNLYLIYVYSADAFLTTHLSQSAYSEDVYQNKSERQFSRL